MGRGSKKFTILRWFPFVDEGPPASSDGGVPPGKVGAVAVARNPRAAQFGEDLSPMIEASVALGRTMRRSAMQPFPVTAGVSGREHAAEGRIFPRPPWPFGGKIPAGAPADAYLAAAPGTAKPSRRTGQLAVA
jgi:hypothetical protein